MNAPFSSFAQNPLSSATANTAQSVAHQGNADGERGDASRACATEELLSAYAARINRGERLNNTERLHRQGLLFNHSGKCGALVTRLRK